MGVQVFLLKASVDFIKQCKRGTVCKFCKIACGETQQTCVKGSETKLQKHIVLLQNVIFSEKTTLLTMSNTFPTVKNGGKRHLWPGAQNSSVLLESQRCHTIYPLSVTATLANQMNM